MNISPEVLAALLDHIAGRGVPHEAEVGATSTDPTIKQMWADDRSAFVKLAFAAQAFLRTCPGVHTKEAEQLELALVDARVRGLIF